MELYQILDVFQSVPFMIWILLFVVLIFLFSDKQLWEYEAKFNYTPEVGSGEIEIEYYQRNQGSIDVHLNLEKKYNNQALQVFLNNKKILDISQDKNKTSVIQIHEEYNFPEPHEGATVEIKCKDNVILSGKLLMD